MCMPQCRHRRALGANEVSGKSIDVKGVGFPTPELGPSLVSASLHCCLPRAGMVQSASQRAFGG